MGSTLPAVSKRLFAGAPLPDELAFGIYRVQKNNRAVPHTRWTVKENLHLTTYFIGRVPVDEMPEIVAHLTTLANSAPSFTLKFEEICLAPSKKPRMVWVKYRHSEDFSRLVKSTGRLMRPDEPLDKTPLPHITIARFKSLKDLGVFNLEHNLNESILKVRKLVLWESITHSTGPEYIPVEEFPLA